MCSSYIYTLYIYICILFVCLFICAEPVAEDSPVPEPLVLPAKPLRLQCGRFP